MMMEQQFIKVAITLDSGQLSIMSFCVVGRGSILPDGAVWVEGAQGMWTRPPSQENLFSEVSRAFSDPNGPQPVKFRVISDSELPTDRDYRNALRDTGTGIEHDMPKARALHLNKLRNARTMQLEQLDRDWMRATAKGDADIAAAIEEQRQRLRDMPQAVRPRLDAAQSVQQLKEVTPS